MKLLDYQGWKKRKILVLKMLTSSEMIEASLASMEIPFVVYDCVEEFDFEKKWEKDQENVCGIIISGSRTVPELKISPVFPQSMLENFPVLGICYGHELLGEILGAKIVPCGSIGEFGQVKAVLKDNDIFQGLDVKRSWVVTMRHDLMLDSLPSKSSLIASTNLTPVAGFYCEEKRWWGLQFHPEKDWMSNIVLRNFYSLCRK